MQISALTQGRNVPSARFRVRQHIQPLATFGIDVAEHCPRVAAVAGFPGALGRVRPRYLGPLGVALIAARVLSRVTGTISTYSADATWLQRALVPNFFTFEGILKRPLYFDIDDAIWLRSPFVSRVASRAHSVIAGNRFLADWASHYCDRVHIVPTAVDVERFFPSSRPEEDRPFVVGWTGSSVNMKYLYDVEQALGTFLANHRDATLTVICDRPPVFRAIPRDSWTYIPWSPDIEASVLRTFHVGIMPLRDTDWERGKCSFKMLQYMATGLPSVVSPVGMNAEILRDAHVALPARTAPEWTETLHVLYKDPTLRRDLGSAARRISIDKYSCNAVVILLANAFCRNNNNAPPPGTNPHDR